MEISLRSTDHFVDRHIGPNNIEIGQMLQTLQLESLDDLIKQTLPASILTRHKLNVPTAQSEAEYIRELKELAARNKLFKSYLGMGYHDTVVPAVIRRNILENPGWYTQYTPYQAEIAQGRLEALLNFQTMVADLTGLPLANASLLDEGTAAAEAMTMLFHEKNKRNKAEAINEIWVDEQCLPQTISVLQTRATPLGIKLRIASPEAFELDNKAFAVLLQYPGVDGAVKAYDSLIAQVHALGAFAVVAADLMSLAVLKAPGAIGADVVVGNTQRFGVPLGFGGPHAAYFATHEKFKRQIPGRIIGVSVDRTGNQAFRMALQTREQHIKREKATSNICTAQALLAIMAGMYAVYHGPEGLKNIATRIHALTRILARELSKLGLEQHNEVYFDTLKISQKALNLEKLRSIAEAESINLRYVENRYITISLDETTTPGEVKQLVELFAKALSREIEIDIPERVETDIILDFPVGLRRESAYLSHSVFNQYHSETEMMRYIKRLENRDLSLTTSMISLGSCTMKLNAAVELLPITWPEFSSIHPFVPSEQVEGYREIVSRMERWLAEITGFSATSLQPNSGAQGEYSGLMTIRAYHEDRGETHRNIVLIPSSAHGTNPASAVMAGMEVVVVKVDEVGSIDLVDLNEKVEQYAAQLAGLMITYPSTHGVFEASVKEVCDKIHAHGGLVYMDGANMNAQVGLTSPAEIGADVCHLNLHKTFAIPHGGGGPGMGPICVNEKLEPYLPKHPLVSTGGEKGISAVSAAPWGSASILLISYAYIRLLGSQGLTRSTEVAILNANYLKERLASAYQVLYEGENGRVAHEFIIDLRPYKHEKGIDAIDVAKRLIDYGYHAPTVSFPVPGTMMIEPTESESKAELDRFVDAMLSIHKEIMESTPESVDNVLRNAPHTWEEVIQENWPYTYSREKAVSPIGYLKTRKFWPLSSRIDNSYGDRNLICTCPPMEAYG